MKQQSSTLLKVNGVIGFLVGVVGLITMIINNFIAINDRYSLYSSNWVYTLEAWLTFVYGIILLATGILALDYYKGDERFRKAGSVLFIVAAGFDLIFSFVAGGFVYQVTAPLTIVASVLYFSNLRLYPKQEAA